MATENNQQWSRSDAPSDVAKRRVDQLQRLNRLVSRFWWVIVILVVARVFELLRLPDGDLYYFTASARAHGGIPGWSSPWEYPPLAGVIVSPLRYLGLENANAYFILALSLPILLLVFFSFWKSQLPYWQAAVAYFTAAALLLGLLFFYRFDSVTVLLSILALLALMQKREYLSGTYLALAAFVKGWPFLLLAATGVVMGRWRLLIPAVISVSMVTFLGFLTQSVPWSWIAFAQGRGIQVESFTALPALWAKYFGINGYEVDTTTYSWANATGPYLGWGFVALVLLSGFAFCIITFKRFNVLRHNVSGFWNQPKLAYLLFCTTLLLIVSPVLSPQFVLWMTPPICVAVAYGWLRREAILSLLALGLSGLIYPHLYLGLIVDTDLFPLLILTLRDGLIIAIALSAACRVWRASPVRDA